MSWRRYEDTLWELDADSPAGDGVLVLSRAHYAGTWEASLDGKPVPLLAANAAYCAVRLPQGSHRVRVQYRDPWLPWTAGAYGLGLLAALSLLGAGLRREGASA